eukprot:TRINITY_DN33131_c0_g1_i1.p1 TRINITY_DN33131_c0_g1~~TRINITY_DN33131_c0_g1_i1.p1  ORF type:complete len:409 (+),score=83.13 TRINITY_DN33131_c0_g1_i1:43-1269(+)
MAPLAPSRRLARVVAQLQPLAAGQCCGQSLPGHAPLRRSLSGAAAAAAPSSSLHSFRAWVVDAEKGKLKAREIRNFRDIRELPQQDPHASVTVRVKYSDLNYKDAMIMQGQHGVVRSFPIVPGIDMSGVVEQSDSPLWKPGDEVVLTGNKIGQHVDGGFSELCRVQAEWLAPKPETFSLEDCMVVGTAGFTAMQMVMELEEAGRLAVGQGPVLVTGAAGGVGSAAVAILASLGYEVVASSGRSAELGDYLRRLGASDVIGRIEGDGIKKPLQDQRWAAVLDCAGGPGLGAALAQTKLRGAVACVGVAAGGSLDATVYPFVLRGVRLLGVDSTLPWRCAGMGDDPSEWQRNRQYRLEVWRRLECNLPIKALREMHEASIPLEEIPAWCDKFAGGQVRGRVVVDLAKRLS